MTPLVSVLVPCHGQGAFVHAAVDSALASTLDALEVIVVDDGSTDAPTRAALDRLHHPRVHLVRQPQAGLGAARNTAARHARGRYLLPLDADDTIEPTFAAAAVRRLEADPALGWAYSHVRFFGDEDFVCRMEPFNFYHLLWENQCCACAVIRSTAFDAVGGYATMAGYEDWDLWIGLAARGWYGALLPEVLFNYRRHGTTMCHAARARHVRLFAEIRARHADVYGDRARLRAIRGAWCRYPLVCDAVLATKMASRAPWFPGWLRAGLVGLRERTAARRKLAPASAAEVA